MQLEEVDADGAVREAYERLPEATRAGFLRRTAGAMGGGVALLAGLGAEPAYAVSSTRPPRRFGPLRFASGDTGVLQYALLLEELESAFYAEATRNGVAGTDLPTSNFLEVTTHDEAAHVRYLRGILGRSAPKAPTFTFGQATTDLDTFRGAALTLETTGVGAYFGQLANLRSARRRRAAITIMTVEARHAGAIASLLGAAAEDLTPNGSFDKALPAAGVLTAVKGTRFVPSLS